MGQQKDWCSRRSAQVNTAYYLGQSSYLGRNNNKVPFQKQGRSDEQPVHIRRGAFQKAIRYRTYHFWNPSFPGHNHHKIRTGPVESSVNKAMFTLYRIVKRSVAESVPDRASVHTRNAALEALSAPEQYCSAPLLKVERSVSDRFLKRSESSLNTFIGAEIATEPRFGK